MNQKGRVVLGRFEAWVALMVLALLFGCGQKSDKTEGTARNAVIVMATTSSTENSGLLDYLLPRFAEETGITVKVHAVGTGKAIRFAEDGNADVVLVHAPKLEESFVADGHGAERYPVMHNDFVILGPPEDPAGVEGMTDAAAAVGKIARAGATFVSRADNSGTHVKELELWKAAGVGPKESDYLETGKKMGGTLLVAHEKRAYVLTDRGTYIAYASKKLIDLPILVEGDTMLFNPYTIIPVNREKHPSARYDEAMELVEWIRSEKGQKLIADFRMDGKVLFHPDVHQTN